MNKIIFFLIATFLLVGCKPTPTNQGQEEVKTFALKTLLDNFLSENPEVANNKVTLNDGAEKLAILIHQNIGDSLGLISELPFEFEAAVEYPPSPFESVELGGYSNDGKCVVKFGFGERTSKLRLSEEYKTTFQVFSVVEKDAAKQLKDGTLYRINGTFMDFANCKGSFFLPGGKCFENPPKISSYNDGLSFNLGTWIVENLSFEQINQ